MTCTEDEDACWYQSLSKLLNHFIHTHAMLINENLGNGDDETVYRSCINAAGLGDHCVDVDVLGVGGTECFCTTDNCNKDNLCDCNSSSTIGLSLSLLASVFAMIMMKWYVNLLEINWCSSSPFLWSQSSALVPFSLFKRNEINITIVT